MNDDGLGRIVSSLPPKAILLIEDIDCAFPSREELDEQIRQSQYAPYQVARSQVTLSGLLNVLDGIGSGDVIHAFY
jgi:mitochondrial chaperone BCS1